MRLHFLKWSLIQFFYLVLVPSQLVSYLFACIILLQAKDQTQWRMSFVMPSKYGSNLPLPKDSSVKIQEVPRKIVAVVAFSGKDTRFHFRI